MVSAAPKNSTFWVAPLSIVAMMGVPPFTANFPERTDGAMNAMRRCDDDAVARGNVTASPTAFGPATAGTP